LPGGTYTHWKAPPFHGAHPQRTSAGLSYCAAQQSSCLNDMLKGVVLTARA